MLFWSFVLAFVLSILYYMSPVHNTVQIEDKPLADTMVATFVNAHQAAKRLTYMDKAGKKNIIKQCDNDFGTGKTDCLDENGNPIEIEVEDTAKREITFRYKEYMQGLKNNPTSYFLSKEDTLSALDSSRQYSDGTLAYIAHTEIKKILPWVKNRDGYNVLYMYNITSAFACITDVATDGDTTTPYLTFDCQGGKGGGTGGKDEDEKDKTPSLGDYVITYMQAPPSDGDSIGRNELWRSGILRRTKGSHECGVLWKTQKKSNDDDGYKITVKARKSNADGDIEETEREIHIDSRKRYDKDSPYIMDNSRRFTVSVPALIGDALYNLKDSGGNYYLREDMESGYLLFCITPMDDIKASFKDKCKRGYGKYIIKEKTDSSTENELLDCRDTTTE